MTKQKMKKIFPIITLVIFLTSILTAQDAKEIIKKSDELIKSKSSYAEVSITIIKTDWSRTV